VLWHNAFALSEGLSSSFKRKKKKREGLSGALISGFGVTIGYVAFFLPKNGSIV
jgi:hypothetical protein